MKNLAEIQLELAELGAKARQEWLQENSEVLLINALKVGDIDTVKYLWRSSDGVNKDLIMLSRALNLTENQPHPIALDWMLEMAVEGGKYYLKRLIEANNHYFIRYAMLNGKFDVAGKAKEAAEKIGISKNAIFNSCVKFRFDYKARQYDSMLSFAIATNRFNLEDKICEMGKEVGLSKRYMFKEYYGFAFEEAAGSNNLSAVNRLGEMSEELNIGLRPFITRAYHDAIRNNNPEMLKRLWEMAGEIGLDRELLLCSGEDENDFWCYGGAVSENNIEMLYCLYELMADSGIDRQELLDGGNNPILTVAAALNNPDDIFKMLLAYFDHAKLDDEFQRVEDSDAEDEIEDKIKDFCRSKFTEYNDPKSNLREEVEILRWLIAQKDIKKEHLHLMEIVKQLLHPPFEVQRPISPYAEECLAKGWLNHPKITARVTLDGDELLPEDVREIVAEYISPNEKGIISAMQDALSGNKKLLPEVLRKMVDEYIQLHEVETIDLPVQAALSTTQSSSSSSSSSSSTSTALPTSGLDISKRIIADLRVAIAQENPEYYSILNRVAPSEILPVVSKILTMSQLEINTTFNVALMTENFAIADKMWDLATPLQRSQLFTFTTQLTGSFGFKWAAGKGLIDIINVMLSSKMLDYALPGSTLPIIHKNFLSGTFSVFSLEGGVREEFVRVQRKTYDAVRLAADNGHFHVVRALFKAATPAQKKAMLKAGEYDVFSSAVAQGELEIVYMLLQEATLAQRVKMLKLNNFAAFRYALQGEHFDVFTTLLAYSNGKNFAAALKVIEKDKEISQDALDFAASFNDRTSDLSRQCHNIRVAKASQKLSYGHLIELLEPISNALTTTSIKRKREEEDVELSAKSLKEEVPTDTTAISSSSSSSVSKEELEATEREKQKEFEAIADSFWLDEAPKSTKEKEKSPEVQAAWAAINEICIGSGSQQEVAPLSRQASPVHQSSTSMSSSSPDQSRKRKVEVDESIGKKTGKSVVTPSPSCSSSSSKAERG